MNAKKASILFGLLIIFAFLLLTVTPGNAAPLKDVPPTPIPEKQVPPIMTEPENVYRGGGDDFYEDNDTIVTAYDLTALEQTWLSTINGYPYQCDDDWYEIYVTSGYENVLIDLRFTHSAGDIDLMLTDSLGHILATSSSVDDNEYIDHKVLLGNAYYYIKVYYTNSCNQYDLWWDDKMTEKSITRSNGTHDGWILESGENTTAGGTLNATATTFNLGDGLQDKQYRAVLSFNTSGLPDDAVITRVLLKIKKQGVVGTDPFNILGKLKVDMRKPYFGTGVGLAASDFQAAAGKANAATFRTTPVNNWYTAVIGATGYPFINLTGITQFRLRFVTGDNDDLTADYMRFFSGNYATAASKPTLVIEYHTP